MGAVVRTVAEIHWRWVQRGNSWDYGATLQLKLPIKLARHDFAWEFKFAKPKRWRIATVEGEIGEETVIRHERPQLLWNSSLIPPAFLRRSHQCPTSRWQLVDANELAEAELFRLGFTLTKPLSSEFRPANKATSPSGSLTLQNLLSLSHLFRPSFPSPALTFR
jgi:hypothetical protein